MKKSIAMFISSLKNKFIITVLLLALLVIAALPGYATIDHGKRLVLSLKDAVMLAMRQNPNVLSGEIDRIVDKYNLRSAEYAFEPQLTLSGGANFEKNSSQQTYNLGPNVLLTNSIGTSFDFKAGQNFTKEPGLDINDSHTVSLNITQPLIKGFGRDVVLAALRDAYDAEETNKLKLKDTVIKAINSVVTDYRTFIQDKNDLSTARNSLKRAELTVVKDRALIKAGRMAKADAGQSKENVESNKISLLSAENKLDQQRLKLLEDIGLNPRTNIIIDDKVPLKKIPIPDEAASIKLALANNIDYVTTVIGLATFKRAVITAEDADKPQLDLTGDILSTSGPNGNLTSISSGAGSSDSASIGLTFSAPIGNVTNKASIVTDKIALEKAEIALAESKRKLIQSVLNDRRQINLSWQQAVVAQQQVQTAKQNEAVAVRKQSYGLVSQFELLGLQNAYTDAEKQATATKITYLNNVTSFRQLLGTLAEDWSLKIRY